MEKHKIRKLAEDDLKSALTLVWNVFLRYEAPSYSIDGVNEFKKFIEYKAIKDKVVKSELFMWGAFDRDKMVGVMAVRRPFHITLMFVDEKYHRQGIARAMFNEVLKGYKEPYGEITVNSSPYAVEVYHKFGFEDTDREQVMNGIRFVPMKKKPLG